MTLPTWLFAIPQRALIGAVRFYRFFFSAWIGNVCRYSPSCSAYALQALEQHGALIGTGLAACRVLRCNPFCLGRHDPVPDRAPRLFGDWFGTPSACSPCPTSSTDKTSP